MNRWLLVSIATGVTVVAVGFAAALAEDSSDEDPRPQLVMPMVARDAPDTSIYQPTATPVPPASPPVVPCRFSPPQPLLGEILRVRIVEDSPQSVQFAIDYVWPDPLVPVCIAIYLLGDSFPNGVAFGTAGQLPEVAPASSGTVLIRAECSIIRFHGGGRPVYFAAGFFTNAPPFYRIPTVGVPMPAKICP